VFDIDKKVGQLDWLLYLTTRIMCPLRVIDFQFIPNTF